jgi:hypothetical protein
MSFFRIFVGSFHSAATYREVRTASRFMIGYSLMLVALSALTVTVYYGAYIHREVFAPRDAKPALFDDVVRQIADQLPVMTLKDDALVSKDAAPTVIRISGGAFEKRFENAAIITIDTRGDADHTTMTTPVLITHKEVIFKTDKETKIQPLSKFTESLGGTTLINQAVAQDLANRLIANVHKNLATFYLLLGSISWFFFAAFMFVMRLCMLLALGLVGLAIGSLTKTPIRYITAVGLASVSYTPVAVLDTIVFLNLHYSPHLLTLLVAGSVTLFAAMRFSRPPISAAQGQ